jgi:hypothetical protein
MSDAVARKVPTKRPFFWHLTRSKMITTLHGRMDARGYWLQAYVKLLTGHAETVSVV